MKFNRLALTALFSSALLLTACGGDKPAASSGDTKSASTATDKLETKFLTIATGGASGAYNTLGTAISEILSNQYGVNSKPQTSGASIENLNLLSQKKVEMAMLQSDSLSAAVNGKPPFDKKIDNVQQIAALYPNYMHIVVSSKSGINTIADLKGKRVSVGSQGGGAEVAARAFLKAFGITYDDIQEDYLGYAETTDGLKGGKLDAALILTGIPSSAIMELQQGFDLKILPVTPEQIAQLQKTDPYYAAMPLPAKTYGDMPEISTVAIINALGVRSDLSEDDVYKITKTIFENLDKLKTAHQSAAVINVADAQKNLVAPLHPGAKRYYDEVNAKGGAASANTATATAEAPKADEKPAETTDKK